MRVIITGGTGLLGRPLTQSFLNDGHEVVVLSRNPDRVQGMPAGTKLVQWDARTADGWGHLADGAGAIINLAGASIGGDSIIPSRWTDARKKLISESRLHAGQAVTAAVAAAETKPDVVVQVSGVGYYGTDNGDEKLTETAPAGSDFPARVCAEFWEPPTAPVEEMGVRRIIARTGQVMSTRGGSLPIQLFQFRMFAGGQMGNGQQWWPWIHIDDWVSVIRHLIDSDAAGIFNVTAEPVQNKTFAKALGRALNRPALIPVPAFAMKLALGEVATLVLDGQRAVPARLNESPLKLAHPGLEAALRHLVTNER